MGTKFTVKKITIDDVDLSEFSSFKAKCTAGGQSGTYARELSREGAVVADNLANWKALLDYSATEAEREAKQRYATVINDTIGTQVVRESTSKKDEEYNKLLDEAAKLQSVLGRIKDAIDFSIRMHYHFKNVADMDTKIPNAADYV